MLVNYWPMSNLTDVIKGIALTSTMSSKIFQTFDRFRNPYSAYYLRYSFFAIPAGNILSSDFTVTLWLNLNSYIPLARVFEFGYGQSETISLLLDNGGKTLCALINNSTVTSRINSTNELSLYTWYHIGFTYSNSYGYLYLNGVLIANGYLNPISNISRSPNYIGKSGDIYIDAVFSDFKIFQGLITANELFYEYNNSSKLYPLNAGTSKDYI